MTDLEERYGFKADFAEMTDDELLKLTDSVRSRPGWGNARAYYMHCLNNEVESRSLNLDVKATVPISELELIQLHQDIVDELKRRSVMQRRINPIGSYVDWLVCKGLTLKQETKLSRDFDAVDRDGLRFKIVGKRTRSESIRIRFSDLRVEPFDYLVVVVMNDNFELRFAAKLPLSDVSARSTNDERTKSYTFGLSENDVLLGIVEDVTKELKFVQRTDSVRSLLKERVVQTQIQELESLTQPVNVLSLACEGGGTEVFARFENGDCQFWSSSSFIELDDKSSTSIEAKVPPTKPQTHDSLVDALPEEWLDLTPTGKILPVFRDELYQCYEFAKSKLSDSDLRQHEASVGRHWQRALRR